MAGVGAWSICVALLCALQVVAVLTLEGPQISNLNLLLPPKASNPVRYRLQGSNGCFDWSVDHGDLLDIEPEFNSTVPGCSTSVVITSKAPYSGRRPTAVHARDQKSGKVLRCEVVIDKISRIAIFHTVLKIDLEGLATLQIRAFDEEDNVFSSLIGLQFAWTFIPLGADKTVHKLRHVPLKETALSGCGCDCGDVWVRIEIEEGELWSDLFVVKGVDPGKEQVSAQLVEPGFPPLEHSVALTVAEAFSLLPPSPVLIIPGTRLDYKIVTYRPDKLEGTPVSLPSPFYKWSIDNATVASIDPKTGHVLAHTLGSALVTVSDTRVEDHFQTSLLKVVIPTRLVLSLRPLDVNAALSRSVSSRALQGKKSDGTWQIVEGKRYVIQVAAFSKDSGKQPLILSEDVDLRLSFDNIPAWITRPVLESEAVENGWVNATILEALQEGTGTLSAALIFGSMVKDGVSGNWGPGPQSVLEAEQEVRVCSKVRVERETLSLPWLPGGAQEFTLRASGGCNLGYNWFSEDPSVAAVDPYGTVLAVGPGETRVFAAAAFDDLNLASTTVKVSVPASLQHVPLAPADVQVGEAVPGAVTLLDAEGHECDNCTAATSFITWHVTSTKQGDESPLSSSPPHSGTVSSQKVRNLQSIIPSNACASHVWWAVRPGLARVSAALNFESSELRRVTQEVDAPRKLATEWTVAVYSPLTLARADNGSSVGGYSSAESGVFEEVWLAPGSAVKIRVKGGPERRGLEEFAEGARGLGGGLTVKQTGQSDQIGGRVYEVTCIELGKGLVGFQKGVAQTNLTVHCEVPAAITLLIDEADNSWSAIRTFAGLERDSSRMHTVTHQVINNRLIRLAAVALNPDLNPFSSADSLTVDWSLDGCDGAQWASLAEKEAGSSSDWERGLLLGERTGSCLIRATVVGLDHHRAKLSRKVAHEVDEEVRKRKGDLTDAATLQLVSALRIEPGFVLLFNNPAVTYTLKVLGGTGSLQAASNDSSVAEIAQEPSEKALQVKPKDFGTVEIVVKDVGLEHPTSASSIVAVSDVAWVKILVSEDLILPVGSSVTVNVEAGDDRGRSFHPSQLRYLHLAVHLSDQTVTIAEEKAAPNQVVIKGTSVGTTMFHVSVRSASGQTIESKSVRVSVFAPLSLHPADLVLAPGADYAIQVQGGPRLNSQVVLSSSDRSIVSLDPVLGLVKGEKEGQARIRAEVRAASGQVLSEAEMSIVVKKLVKPGLHIGSGRLGVGEEMDIFPEGGKENEDLMSFAQVCYGYVWSVADPEVMQVQSEESLEVPRSKDPLADLQGGFSARLTGKSAGRTTVSISFSCRYGPPGTPPKKYNASATLLVVDDIPVNRGCCATWLLSPHHETTFALPYFECCGPETTIYTMLQTCPPANQADNYVVKIQEDGVLQTGSRLDLECIHARVRSTGRAGLAACVRVADIAQMTVGDDTFPWHSAELSVGASQSFTVTFRDEFGSPFLETPRYSLHVEANHPEIVAVYQDSLLVSNGEIQATRSQVVVKALKQGTALVRVHLASNPKIADFLVIRVGAYVCPREPTLHLGSRIGFAAGTAGGSREEGRWSSGNSGVVRIDPVSGEALALGPGSTTVHFNGSRLTTYTTVTVVPVASASLKQPQGVPFFTNAQPDAEYKFPVIFKTANGQEINPPHVAAVAPYECQLTPAFLGHAHAWQNESSGAPFCVVHTEDPESIALSRADAQQPLADRIGSVRGSLRVNIPASGDVPKVEGQPEQFQFVGGFALASGTPPELYLYKSTNRTIVSLVGNAADVIVSWGHRDAVVIRRVSRAEEAAGLSGRALYEIKLLQPGSSLSDKAVFRSEKTAQTVELPFHYDAGGTPVLGYTLLAAILALVSALLIASARALWNAFANRPSNPPAPPPAGGAQNPQTPPPPTPAPTITPTQNGDTLRFRTPPDVRNYLEQTIERTPGYRTSPLKYSPLSDY